MVNRKEEQGDEAIEKIKAECKEEGKEAKIEWKGCDLGDLKMVREVFGKLEKELDRLDLVCPRHTIQSTRIYARELGAVGFTDSVQLILSAGINSNQFGLSNDGIDRHFSVNALGHYYVINLLYPLLRKTSKQPGTTPGSVRIVFESSEMHRFAPGSADSKSRARGCHFGSEEEITEAGKELGPVELYGRTKLAMILYGKALRDRVIKPNGDDIYV